MAEIGTVTTLMRKRDEISHAIRNYEKKIARAKSDLAHITAAIRIFEASGDAKGLQAYADLLRLFRPREMVTRAKAALAAGSMATKELALILMKEKGLGRSGARLLLF